MQITKHEMASEDYTDRSFDVVLLRLRSDLSRALV
jgi:hypothetical protein